MEWDFLIAPFPDHYLLVPFYDGPRLKAIRVSWFESELLVYCLTHPGSIVVFLLLRFSVSYWTPRDRRAAY